MKAKVILLILVFLSGVLVCKSVSNYHKQKSIIVDLQETLNQTKIVESKEVMHTMNSMVITDEINNNEKVFNDSINSIKYSNDFCLYEPTTRTEEYYKLSKTNAVKQKLVAEYTAKLERSLTESRQLVKELTATITERESTIQSLNKQLHLDRQLTGELNESAK